MNLIFYFTLFLFIALFGTIDNVIDYDFWARLVVGKSFFQTGTLFNNEFQSYGTTHEFIDHEWGSSLVFYFIQNYFGDIGLYIFKTLLIFLTFFIITKIIKLKDKNSKLYFLFFFFIIHAISYTIFATIRCQTFSFLFFVSYIYILEFAKIKKNYRVLYVLPILNIIWLNMHGGFVLGLATIFIYIIGELLNKKDYKYVKNLSYSFIISILTCFINPYGIKYLIFIFDAFKLDRIHISEWQSAFFNKRYILYLLKFKIFFIITILLFLYSIIKQIKLYSFKEYFKKIDKTKYLMLLFVTLIALKALRCHVFFAYCILIYCYSDFYKIFNKKLPERIDSFKDTILLCLIMLSTSCHLFLYDYTNTVRNYAYPIYCVECIKKNNLAGNVFCNFHLGSYVSYKLYPNNYVFMDGRYEEVYDNELINKMGDFFLGKNYKKFLKEFHHDILIIDNNYPVLDLLKKDNDWIEVYSDNFYTLFLPKKFKNKKFIQPTKDKKYYDKTKFETKINWLI